MYRVLFGGIAVILGAVALAVHKDNVELEEEISSDEDLQDENIAESSTNISESESMSGFDSDTVSPLSTEKDDKLEVLLTTFTGVSKSYTNALAAAGVLTTKQFLRKTDEELLEIKGVGEKSVALIHEKIEEM
jgi:DNA-directed RNA polymerase alpha subunit